MAASIIFCVCVLSSLSAGLFDPLEKDIASNAAQCSLLTAAHCAQVKACMVSGSNCIADPCYERLVLSSNNCKTDVSGVTCSHVPIFGGSGNSPYCVTNTRLAEFTTAEDVCNLEWGEFKVPEYGLCNLAGSTCGKLDSIQGEGYSYYLCKVGTEPTDPCNPFLEADCPYIKECMWENGSDTCVNDPCWERTLASGDSCRPGCEAHELNPGEGTTTPKTGYCKSAGVDLASPCNALSQPLISTGVCTTIPPLPDKFNCTSYATVNNYEGKTLYVCNPEKKEIDAGFSLNSFVVAVLSAILLILML